MAKLCDVGLSSSYEATGGEAGENGDSARIGSGQWRRRRGRGSSQEEGVHLTIQDAVPRNLPSVIDAVRRDEPPPIRGSIAIDQSIQVCHHPIGEDESVRFITGRRQLAFANNLAK